MQYSLLESYEPTGKIGHISYGNGTATDYSYDSLSTRLTSIITAGAAEILNKAYIYTPAGDIASITDTQSGVTYSYTYDRLHRLVSETNDGPSDNFSQATLVSTYNDSYRPLHAPDSIRYNGSEHFYTDDANGNLTGIPDFSDSYYNSYPRSAFNSITYNADNMPICISNRKDDGAMVSTIAVDFTYDGNGTRAKKALSNGDTTYYIGNHFEVANGVETKYIFAGNQRIAKVTDTNTTYFHKDHLGSSTVMTDTSGSTLETGGYLPYGIERENPGITLTNYKFTDQEKDTETGLYNYDARMYDPVIALFISADSIIPDYYDPQSLNRYAYCRNNPLKYVDPDGHAYDLIDIGFFVQSAYTFARNPSWSNAGWLAADTVSLAPVVPSLGYGRVATKIAGKVADVASSANKADNSAKSLKALENAPKSGIVNKGGRFADLDKAKNAGEEVGHHMPQNAFNKTKGTSRSDGPALGMTTKDHALTRTFKGKGKAAMREDVGLTARQRMAKDIKDVRKNFGRKYNKGSLEAIDYAKKRKE